MYLEIFLADFAVIRFFGGISQYFAEIPEFAGQRPHKISEALTLQCVCISDPFEDVILIL